MAPSSRVPVIRACKLLDRMIAAQAIVHRASLVTMNASDYADIPNLSLVSW